MRIQGSNFTCVVRNLREEGWYDMYVRIGRYYCQIDRRVSTNVIKFSQYERHHRPKSSDSIVPRRLKVTSKKIKSK